MFFLCAACDDDPGKYDSYSPGYYLVLLAMYAYMIFHICLCIMFSVELYHVIMYKH